MMNDYGPIDFDNLPEPDPDWFKPEEEPTGRYIGGEWVDAEDLILRHGNDPSWWDSDAFGESFDEYMEHTDF